MLNTSWSVRAWTPLLWQAKGAAHLRFDHLNTQIFHSGSEDTPVSGQTVWRTDAPDGEVGVAWDWVMLSDDVIAMADPMCVVTSWEAARHLSQIVYGLPWQGVVQREVKRHLND
jgi:hypothetical protein